MREYLHAITSLAFYAIIEDMTQGAVLAMLSFTVVA